MDKISRREALGAMATGVVALLSGCGKKDTPLVKEDIDSSRAQIKEAVNDVTASTEKVALSVDLPQFEFRETSDFGKDMPAGLTMDKDEFIRSMGLFIEMTKQGLREYLLPRIKAAPQNNERETFQFLIKMPLGIKGLHTELQRHFTEAELKLGPGKDIKYLINLLNSYLIPAGYVILHSLDVDFRFAFDIYPIKKTTSADVKSKELGEKNVPILHLERGLIELEKARQEGKNSKDIVTNSLGFHAKDQEFVVFFEDEIETAHSQTVERFIELFGDEAENFKREHFVEDLLRHETLHPRLSARFPEKRSMAVNKGLLVSLQLKVGPGFADFSNVYHVSMFHELAGVGMQLARTEIETPYYIYSYVAGDFGRTYHLVHRLVPILLLQHGPENSIKKRLIELLTTNLSVENKDFADYIGTLSTEEIRIIGAKMYELAYDLLKRAESGEFREVQLAE